MSDEIDNDPAFGNIESYNSQEKFVPRVRVVNTRHFKKGIIETIEIIFPFKEGSIATRQLRVTLKDASDPESTLNSAKEFFGILFKSDKFDGLRGKFADTQLEVEYRLPSDYDKLGRPIYNLSNISEQIPVANLQILDPKNEDPSILYFRKSGNKIYLVLLCADNSRLRFGKYIRARIF